VDQGHVVRHKVLMEGRSQRQVAKELGIARDTVRKYLTESIPLRKEPQPRPRPVWEAVRARVESLLEESKHWTGGKQRLTATRLHELLVAEGKPVGVTLVKEAVAEWKRPHYSIVSRTTPPSSPPKARATACANAAVDRRTRRMNRPPSGLLSERRTGLVSERRAHHGTSGQLGQRRYGAAWRPTMPGRRRPSGGD